MEAHYGCSLSKLSKSDHIPGFSKWNRIYTMAFKNLINEKSTISLTINKLTRILNVSTEKTELFLSTPRLNKTI